jgi:hypothetical protein
MQKCLVVTQTGKKCQNSRNCPHHRQTGGELPAFLALPLRGLTLLSKEIPVGGQAVALIDVIMRNAAFLEKFIELRKASAIIQQLTTINFREGPDGVKRQFDQLWSSIPAAQHANYCDVVPQLYNDLLIAVCGWVETIPTVGPPVSVVIQATAGFEMMRSIYIGLPPNSQVLFENPEGLTQVVDEVVLQIYDTLGVDAPRPPPLQTGGGLPKWASALAHKAITATTRVASTIVAHEAEKIAINVKLAQSVGKTLIKPVMIGLNAVGVDKILAEQVVSYTTRVLRPATTGAIEALKIIFPLFFALLCIVEECRDSKIGGSDGRRRRHDFETIESHGYSSRRENDHRRAVCETAAFRPGFSPKASRVRAHAWRSTLVV